MANKPKIEQPAHENFKLGQGYGSSEEGSEFQTHPSEHQYGDNPLPESGGNYKEAGEMQPKKILKPTGHQVEKSQNVEPL